MDLERVGLFARSLQLIYSKNNQVVSFPGNLTGLAVAISLKPVYIKFRYF